MMDLNWLRWILMVFAGVLCLAHAPHDEVNVVGVSPNFASDQMVIGECYFSDYNLIVISNDGGRSWKEFASPVLSFTIRKFVFSPDFSQDEKIYVSTLFGGVWLSEDSGLTWKPRNQGLTSNRINDLAVSPDFAKDKTLMAATDSGLFRSTDGGGSWIQVTSGIIDTDLRVVGFAPNNASTVFTGGYNLHGSFDGGVTFTPLSGFSKKMKALTLSPNFKTDSAMAILLRGQDGVLASIDGGMNWVGADSGLTDLKVNDITFANDGSLFLVTNEHGCFHAQSLLSPWVLKNKGFEELSDQTDKHYRAVSCSPSFGADGVVFVASFEGMFKTDNQGDSWRQCNVYNQNLFRVIALSPNFGEDELLFGGNMGGGPYLWKGKNTGSSKGVSHKTSKIKNGGGKPCSPFLGTPGAGALNLNLPSRWKATGHAVPSLYSTVVSVSPDFKNDQTLFYAYSGLTLSQDGGQSWIRMTSPCKIPREIVYSPQFTADQTLYMGSGAEGTYLSQDGGYNWMELKGGLPSDVITRNIRLSPQFPMDPTIFLASWNKGLWRSMDQGLTWMKLTNGMTTELMRCMDMSPDFVNDGMLLAGTDGQGLFRSDDSGNTWSSVNNDFPSKDLNVIVSIAFSPDFVMDRTVFAASAYDGIYKSTDGGWTWKPANTGLPGDAPRMIGISHNYKKDRTLFLSTYNWLYRSKNGGADWKRMPGYNRVDDHHQSIYCEGDWKKTKTYGGFAGGVSVSKETDAYMELEFYGDRVAWFAVKNQESGVAEILIDGIPIVLADLYSPAPTGSKQVFKETFQTKDWRRIKVRITGIKNLNSLDNNVFSDGFEITF